MPLAPIFVPKIAGIVSCLRAYGLELVDYASFLKEEVSSNSKHSLSIGPSLTASSHNQHHRMTSFSLVRGADCLLIP